jgi:hypothetical protein
MCISVPPYSVVETARASSGRGEAPAPGEATEWAPVEGPLGDGPHFLAPGRRGEGAIRPVWSVEARRAFGRRPPPSSWSGLDELDSEQLERVGQVPVTRVDRLAVGVAHPRLTAGRLEDRPVLELVAEA